MDAVKQKEAIDILKAVIPLLQQLGSEAECRHDDPDDPAYMDSVAFETMQQTQSLIERATTLINQFDA